MTDAPTTQPPTTVTPEEALSNAEKLRARLDYLEDWYFRPQAYEKKISQWEVEELRKHRPSLWKTEAEPETDTVETQSAALSIPKSVERQVDLAAVLHGYFQDQISIAITDSVIGNWRKGVGVGKVIIDGKTVIPPKFPNKNEGGKRWTTAVCIKWVEDWIVPQKKAQPGMAGNGNAADFDDIKKEHAIWQMQREKDKENGKFKSVEIYNNHLIAMGSAINRALNAAEKDLKKDMTPEAMMDGLRAAVVKALREAEETVGVATEEAK